MFPPLHRINRTENEQKSFSPEAKPLETTLAFHLGLIKEYQGEVLSRSVVYLISRKNPLIPGFSNISSALRRWKNTFDECFSLPQLFTTTESEYFLVVLDNLFLLLFFFFWLVFFGKIVAGGLLCCRTANSTRCSSSILLFFSLFGMFLSFFLGRKNNPERSGQIAITPGGLSPLKIWLKFSIHLRGGWTEQKGERVRRKDCNYFIFLISNPKIHGFLAN